MKKARRGSYEKMWGTFAAIAIGLAGAAQAMSADHPNHSESLPSMDTIKHLHDYQVIELRRYTTTDGAAPRFAKYFDSYFPEAFEQLGAMVFGQFLERANPNHFTWLRGYKDLPARPVVNASFYYGPLWREHREKINAILPDSDNVMLLHPLRPETGVTVLPAVDPVLEEKGAQGVGVMQVIAIKKGHEADVAQQAEALFASYRMAGVHPAGILVTLDVPNNFPQLPIRTDGPWLVWLGIVQDNKVLQNQLKPAMKTAAQTLLDTGLLREAPELIELNPTPRSRLRWLSDAQAGP
ncbi:NIPSNAP family protein [Dyella tabacisoli]|uniref:NIPSNAP domain-containing protein n=1 Tax=Dyella tabacisoli TaxID=2282381 RepID=A0A369URT7_9GAMM|nr:NIPSNAP family protein [Dyella tabacisoli]RDD83023.1 hypothetical protein DVJ77_04010 [Dyella tabacisoli]